jgi:hypothetical protein
VTQTFREKLAEIEAKRRLEQSEQIVLPKADLKVPELLEEESENSLDEPVSAKLSSKSKIKPMTLAIFVSLFVIVLAQIYTLGGFSITQEVKQTSLDQSFIYKGGKADGLFSGKATITDKAGNILTANFKAGKMIGEMTYTKKNGYLVAQKSDKIAQITLPDQTLVTQKGNNFVVQSTNFSYDGAWRFAGTWQGKMHFANNAEYDGAWKNGLPEGQGVYTTISGTPIEGTFKFGVPEE